MTLSPIAFSPRIELSHLNFERLGEKQHRDLCLRSQLGVFHHQLSQSWVWIPGRFLPWRCSGESGCRLAFGAWISYAGLPASARASRVLRRPIPIKAPRSSFPELGRGCPRFPAGIPLPTLLLQILRAMRFMPYTPNDLSIMNGWQW